MRTKYAIVQHGRNYYVKAVTSITDEDKIIEEFDNRWDADNKLSEYLGTFKKAIGFSDLIKRLKAICFANNKRMKNKKK